MEKYKKSCKNNKFKKSVPTWNEEFELPDGSNSVSNIQDYFKYLLKWHETDDPSIRIYVNKLENRVTFKIKTGYYLELLKPATKNLFGSTKTNISKDKNGETTEVILVHCNIVNNDCQHDQESCIHLFQINKLVNY